ncbi:hypothetical protein AK830_g897 [Neonectria ditissima]|uniref:protein-tyrosine-phosphatase n=1 Tax=Neonectria ditissima TaxID=78410 RepID=A0A0N8H8U5_9HYPO|nr:hypothetical protein AK830_g897 [Neonectria ditissima]
MKTPARHATTPGPQSHHHSHSQSLSQSLRPSVKQTKTSTPVASPRMPYSVGQSLPPKLSPRAVPDARAPSPNYFGLVVETNNDPRESSSALPRDTWSPSSSVKSFGAAIPKSVPLDANPEFEAFKRQADFNRGNSFALSSSHYAQPPAAITPVRPRAPRWHTSSGETPTESPFGRAAIPAMTPAKERPASRMDVDQDSMHDSAYVSSDSKRNSGASMQPPLITNTVRFESPSIMDAHQQRTSLTRSEDRDPRLSVMEHKVDPPSPSMAGLTRAETVPVSNPPGEPAMITGAQLRDMIRNSGEDRLLLLDIRSSQNYANSRIEGALNLCIPTTLLKRATFNIQKLQQTFQKGPDGERFARWQEMDSIVVYDAHSSDKRDAVTAQNMIKKFTNEGYSGGICILRGGFNAFQQEFSELVDYKSTTQPSGGFGGAGPGGFAPVIGGVMLPNTNKDSNPFFSNIRQNMDLADGVGQLDVSRPTALESPSLPRWLREAASQPDHGKKVSDKFLHIEVDEQSRMRAAYAAFNPNNNTKQNQVQLCGVEKGVKNRYKDILPFEHARVKLQEKPTGSCDYVNASHLKASRSNKRYIATQGPLPATFEDFWSVIWEQDVRVIVMLTAESEGGQLKCHPYWKERDFGAIRLKPLSEKRVSLDIDKHKADSSSSSSSAEQVRRRAATTTTLDSATPTPKPLQGQTEIPYVIVRKFALSHTAHPFDPIREITHLHFPSWPDFGTPAQPSHLLALVELANVMQRSALPVETTSVMGSKRSPAEHTPITWYDEPELDARARPMLVHCSAGCGRTGAFCTVDSVIDMMKRQRQARAVASTGRDAEGDVSMGDARDDPSPRTQKKVRVDSTQRSSMEKAASRSPASLDTSFVHDESVDLIERTVEDFREQRLSMVQSLRQFVLCYETILEWATRINDRGASASSGRMRSGSLQQPRC